MIVFWLALFGLMIIAVLMLLWPMSTKNWVGNNSTRGDNKTERTQINIELFKQRLADIDEEHAQGVLDDESAELLRQELQKQLLDDASNVAPSSDSTKPRRTCLILFTALMLPALALVFYSKTGEPEAWTLPVLIKQSERAYEAGVDNTSILERLASQLSAFPDRTDFIALQARILMQLQQYSEAASIYADLQKRFPEDALLMGQSIQARYLANNRQFDAAMESESRKALALEPAQPTLLGLLGMYAFEQQRYREAVKYWETLVAILPPESAQMAVIQGPLERARILAKGTDGLDSEESVEAAAETTKDAITVTVNAQFKDVPANAILFVFAKSGEEGAPPMPLAVQRIVAPTFPLTVKLDDSLAMMPTLKLSGVDNVIITARLSTSGDVRGNDGDKEVSTETLKWRELKGTVELQLK